MDNGRSYTRHLEKVCGKASALVKTLRTFLPNVNGPTGSITELYYGVCESVVLYAVPIWARALAIKK